MGCNNGFGGGGCLWILLIIIIICCCFKEVRSNIPEIVVTGCKRSGTALLILLTSSFMVGCFVVLRQIYLMITIPLTGKLELVFAGWPITWVVCAAGMLFYFVKAKWLPEE